MPETFFKIHFDKDGQPVNPAEQAALIQALTAEVPPISDLWIMSHGWKTGESKADYTYEIWSGHLKNCIEAEVHDPAYRAAFVGIYWPSMGLPDFLTEQTEPTVSPSTFESLDRGEYELEDESPSDIEIENIQPEIALNTFLPSTKTETERETFVAYYQAIFGDGQTSRLDFERLYQLVFETDTPDRAQIEEFISLLDKYRQADPDLDPMEPYDIFNSPAQLRQVLEDEILETHKEVTKSFGGKLVGVLRNATFWNMKNRAAIVGQNGAARFIEAVKEGTQTRPVKIHLIGHSFGAKLLTTAVDKPGTELNQISPIVNSLTLILGAFSQFAFSSDIPVEVGARGRYANLVEHRLIATPIIVIYSHHDRANLEAYPLGMRLVSVDRRYEIFGGKPSEKYGALGANGAQGLKNEARGLVELKNLDTPYDTASYRHYAVLNVDGSDIIIRDKDKPFVGSHGDHDHAEIFHLALAFSLADSHL